MIDARSLGKLALAHASFAKLTFEPQVEHDGTRPTVTQPAELHRECDAVRAERRTAERDCRNSVRRADRLLGAALDPVGARPGRSAMRRRQRDRARRTRNAAASCDGKAVVRRDVPVGANATGRGAILRAWTLRSSGRAGVGTNRSPASGRQLRAVIAVRLGSLRLASMWHPRHERRRCPQLRPRGRADFRSVATRTGPLATAH
jgi:hypothetical protein